MENVKYLLFKLVDAWVVVRVLELVEIFVREEAFLVGDLRVCTFHNESSYGSSGHEVFA